MEAVTATLNYVAPGSKRNRLYVAPGSHLSTTEYEPHEVRVADGRPYRAELSLDRAGFTLLDHRSAVTDFRAAEEVGLLYPGEAERLVAEVTGADHVAAVGWVLRSAADDRGGAQPTASDVHVDVHPDRAAGRLRDFHDRLGLPGRAFRRAIFSSLWRPFSPPPQDWPLALCDYRSTGDGEGVPNLMLVVDALPDPDTVPDVVPDADARPAASVFAYNPAHRWWYFPRMHAGEALLFKLHDSDHSVAWRAPHTAFRDPSVTAGQPRESIEIRTVAFFY
ncbi:CmcJ/NvfI family oxidoreductase [Trebonia sp.]|uniref:CmcJ/NvfI family oxidoreductase n=1 Tax=Trebonia sp. TaxID=2767075 RepID=UPI00260C2EA2|nr:CmcJ/NvfI family oxidoreductase [Trebonia sp.]